MNLGRSLNNLMDDLLSGRSRLEPTREMVTCCDVEDKRLFRPPAGVLEGRVVLGLKKVGRGQCATIVGYENGVLSSEEMKQGTEAS